MGNASIYRLQTPKVHAHTHTHSVSKGAYLFTRLVCFFIGAPSRFPKPTRRCDNVSLMKNKWGRKSNYASSLLRLHPESKDAKDEELELQLQLQPAHADRSGKGP